MVWYARRSSASKRPSAAAGSDSQSDWRSARILIVEDEFFIAIELEYRLLEAGYSVVGIAVTAGEA